MSLPWIDAHNHLQDPRLAAELPEILTQLELLNIETAVVNGTHPSDWAAVADLARTRTWIQPAYGLHPWFIAGRPAEWIEQLESHLDEGGTMGEIGLDRWKEGLDFEDQQGVFDQQLTVACRRNLPVTVHCLKAWGALLEMLEARTPPGFLLHSYSGPVEMVERFVQLGARFSFSGYFLVPRKEAVREVFRHIPKTRLLVETDAPDMALPEPLRSHFLNDPKSNHPANIIAVYSGLAQVLRMPVEELAGQVAENFRQLFSSA